MPANISCHVHERSARDGRLVLSCLACIWFSFACSLGHLFQKNTRVPWYSSKTTFREKTEVQRWAVRRSQGTQILISSRQTSHKHTRKNTEVREKRTISTKTPDETFLTLRFTHPVHVHSSKTVHKPKPQITHKSWVWVHTSQ